MDVTAINPDFIKSVTLCNEYKSTKYQILHRKGEMHTVFNWRKFRHEEVPYEDDVIYYIDWWGEGTVSGTDVLKDYHVVKEDGVYVKPCVDIRYKDGKLYSEYYDSYEDALRIYTILVIEKNLVEL